MEIIVCDLLHTGGRAAIGWPGEAQRDPLAESFKHPLLLG